MSSATAPSLPSRSGALDLLRTLAIWLVFTSHFRNFAGQEWFDSISQIGWTGVDLFFVLSGFLISSQLFKTMQTRGAISLQDFYLRRGFRIWPSFFAVLLIYCTVPAFVERSVLPPLWKFFTFTQNFNLDFRTTGAFSHAWSLCVEEQFYLFLPLLIVWLYPRLRARTAALIFATIIGGGILLRYWLWNHFVAPVFGINMGAELTQYYREIYYPTYCRLDGLTIGVAVAAIYRFRPALWTRLGQSAHTFLGIGFALLLTAYLASQEEHSLLLATLGFPLWNLGYGCLLVAAVTPGSAFARLRLPLVETTATLAFSFYLTHKSVIHLTKNWLLDAGVTSDSILYPLGIFAACLCASIALYWAVERPFLRMRDRMLEWAAVKGPSLKAATAPIPRR